MRRLRIAAPAQLTLVVGEDNVRPAPVWPAMPEGVQAEVLDLLARLIARGVAVDDEEPAR